MLRQISVLLLLGAAATAAPAQENVHATHHAPTHKAAAMPRLDGLGSWPLGLTAGAGEAREYFEQGLRLAYGFNHEEARRSFERAAEIDPACALCYWGIAYSVSPNINMPMDSAAEVVALAAITRARQLAPMAAKPDRLFIDALAHRFGEPAGAKRAARDSAYARAMKNVVAQRPDNVEAFVLYADALLNLRPWQQWTRAGKPQPGTLDAVAALERARALGPDHAGACHFWIHTVEASPTPERALECAEKLPTLMPGAGHIVHMPAHVYLRVGLYEDAARANIAAVEADHGYFKKRDMPEGIYPMFYHPHNLHFLWAAYLTSGQYTKALGAARALRARVDIEAAREVPSLQAFLTPEILTHARFAAWDSVLAIADYAGGLPFASAMRHYARGQAFYALGNAAAAAQELAALRAITRELPADMVIILNAAQAITGIAERVLEAAAAVNTMDYDRAIALLQEAAAMEDELTYDEPPPWHQPVRQMLGNVQLRAGRYADAVVTFRADLRWVPRNGWSLNGLATALRALGRTAEASAVEREFEAAWQHADTDLGELNARGAALLPALRFNKTRLPDGTVLRHAEQGNAHGDVMVMLHWERPERLARDIMQFVHDSAAGPQ